MKEIQLTQGKAAIVDDEDFEKLSESKWFYSGHGYAVGNATTINGKKYQVKMHIQIMGKIEGLEIDHVNGDPLDNRKENLRHVTHAQNMYNVKARAGETSKHKGVSWDKRSEMWRSVITIDRKQYSLGYYDNERDAAWVYNVWAESMFGEYARLSEVSA